jgi:O-antigen/teichoic acid export membrane protein
MTEPAHTSGREGTAAAPSSAWSHAVALAVGTSVANVLGYGFNAIMSRQLGVSGYGELGSLLAVIVVASVPGTALQAVIARRLSAGQLRAHVGQTTALLSLAVGAATLLISPALKAFLAIGSYTPLFWTAVSLVPTTIAFGWQGLLQGSGRYRSLGVLIVAIQLARVLGALLAVATDTGTSMALAGGTLFTAVLVAVTAPSVLAVAGTATRGRRAMLMDVARDISPILGVLVLSNLDLLLARHYLPEYDSGLYAAGNLVTRAAFWGPAFIVLMSYPQLAVPEKRPEALRRGVRLLVIVSVIGIIGSILAAGLVPVVLGQAYEAITDDVWLFALNGFALVGVQFAVFAGLAVADRRVGRLVWLAIVVECVIVGALTHGSITQIIGTAVGCSLTLLAASATVEIRRARRGR